MADDKASSNEVEDDAGDDLEPADDANYDDVSATTTATIGQESSTTIEDYADDDEPIPDYIVNLNVNEAPADSTFSSDLVNAVITDTNGNPIAGRTSTLIDSINGYTTALYDELNGNGTAITDGGKRWWGWSTRNIIIGLLIALCLIGIIAAILFFVFGKKFRKNKRTATAGATTTTKAVVTKGIAPDQKYKQLPNV